MPKVPDESLDIGHELVREGGCQPSNRTAGGVVASAGTVANASTVTETVVVRSSPEPLIAEMATAYSPGGVVSGTPSMT